MRLMFDRSADPTDVLSALDGAGGAAEEGLEVDAPVAYSVNGLMQPYAGGDPILAETYAMAISRPGNVGNAEWGFNFSGDTYVNGVCGSWIPDHIVNFNANDPASMPRMKRCDHPEDAKRPFVFFSEDQDLQFMWYTPSTRTWSASPQTVADDITSGAHADGLMFPDTGEMVIFCDGKCYSADGDHYTSGSSYAVKGMATDWDSVNNHSTTIVNARGRLVVLYINTNKIYAIVSNDRGATWSLETCVSDDFVDAINEADTLHAVVSASDGSIYMVVEDDHDGTGNDDYARIYRSSDGLEWEQTDVWISGVGEVYQLLTIMAMEDGTLIVYYVRDDDNSVNWFWLTEGGKFRAQSTRTLGRITYGKVLRGGGALGYMAQLIAVDMGEECVGVLHFNGSGGAEDCYIGMSLRQWSNISEEEPYNSICWANTQHYQPDEGWGWTEAGTGTTTLALTDMRLQTTVIDPERSYSYNEGAPAGSTQPDKIKFRVKVGAASDLSSGDKLGFRYQFETAGGHGVDFGLLFDLNGIQIYDYGAAAFVGTEVAIDMSDEIELYVTVICDETNGGAVVSVFKRVTTGGDGYPHDYWTNVLQVSPGDDAPFGSNQWTVKFGNLDSQTGDMDTRWYYFLMGKGDTSDAVTTSYANTTADWSDLSGKQCSHLAQEMTDAIKIWWRGAAAYAADVWTLATRYLFGKENILDADPRRGYRSDADEQVVNVAFHQDNDRPYRADFLALTGINFEKFYIEGDSAATFDSDTGNPEFSLYCGWGDAAGDNAVGLVMPTSSIEAIDEDWIQITPAHGLSTALWKGRYDKDSITGKRYWVRVLTGAAAGNVYAVESIEMLDDSGGASWQIRLGPDVDGNFPTLTSDGVTTDHMVGIFGDAIAVEIPYDVFRTSGYRYVRIRIPSQKTWDGDYRIGHAMWSMSAPLGRGLHFSSQWVPEISDPNHEIPLEVQPNVEATISTDGHVSKRRRGRAARSVQLTWAGQIGIDSWQTAVRAVLQAAAEDTPVVFLDNDSFQHTGPTAPTGTVCKVCYDPILCYLTGAMVNSGQTFVEFSPRYGTADLLGRLTSISGVTLTEIV